MERAFSVERVSTEVLKERFHGFFQCEVNGACARAMVAARDCAIEALQDHGGDTRDYLATKYSLAWQYLGIIGTHTGLARA